MSQNFTDATIRQLAREHYLLTVIDVQPLAGEVDLNFRLTAEDGAKYTLKISAPGQDRGAIDFQYALLAHLAGKDLPFATPAPVGNVIELPEGRLLRLLTWVSGKMLDEVNPRTAQLREAWGQTAGLLTTALDGFAHPHAPASFKWNPSQTLDYRPLAQYMTTEQAELANHFWDWFLEQALPQLPGLRKSVNYNDAHEHNLLVDANNHICGVIDFGDAMYTHTINELAIACAYAGMGLADPIAGMAEVVAGYRRAAELPEAEIGLLLPLIIGRLLLTVATAAENVHKEPDNHYLQISAAPAWALLARLREVPPTLAEACFRVTCGLPAHQKTNEFATWLAQQRDLHSVIQLTGKTLIPMDLSVGSLDLGNHQNYEETTRFTRRIARHLEDQGADFGIGGYGETRPVYTTDDFAEAGNYGPRWRTVHLGLDVWGPAGTPIYAPFNATVHSFGIDPTMHGYGHVLILQHHEDGHTFYTLYGHLTTDSVAGLRAGTQVQKGDEIARFGAPFENGGWPPHLHFQVMLDMLGYVGDFPGVAYPGEAKVWLGLCPDALPFFNVSAASPDSLGGRVRASPASADERVRTEDRFNHRPADESGLPAASADERAMLLSARKKSLGYSLSVSYRQPLHIVRGVRQYLMDVTGRRYLDTVNNVAHVGHEHPKVVEAIQRQAAVLNTNTRYLHAGIVRFAEQLSATMPPELSVVHFVNSGSEANELAMRMCEAWSGTQNMLAVEVGYHGNTSRTIDVSSYKFNGKGGKGAPPRTRLLPLPDVFRGIHRDPATAGRTYGAYAGKIIREWEAAGEKIGGFIGESILSCGGQIVLPEGYLAEVYGHVRAAGGLCIADEVQVGVGRVGSHFWGFELQGVVPDIVTIGKPLGNGHPLGAVVCTPAVARAFANGMEYFNTFGGNAVSCAAGMAVLDVVREEGLQPHALEVGDYTKSLLLELQQRHPLIGDVRGEGLFLGFELVKPSTAPAAAPDQSLLPATRQAAYLKNRMRELGFLMSTDGPDENVIKIKPPMCFDRRNADLLVEYLDKVLGEDGAQ